MIISKKEINAYTTASEDMVFAECYEAINSIMAQMVSNDCNEMRSTSTGEVITYDDFRRMLGILGGLPYINRMYKVEE